MQCYATQKRVSNAMLTQRATQRCDTPVSAAAMPWLRSETRLFLLTLIVWLKYELAARAFRDIFFLDGAKEKDQIEGAHSFHFKTALLWQRQFDGLLTSR